MQHKSKILLRLNILYGIFLILLFLSLGNTFFSGDFQAGLQEGFRQSMETCLPDNAKTDIYPEIALERKPGKYEIPVTCPADTNISIFVRVTQIDATIKGNHSSSRSILTGFLLTTSIFCYIVIVVILALILHSLRKSIKRGNIFNRDNIKLIRAIAILIISSSLLSSLGRYIEIRQTIQLFAGTEWHPVWNGMEYKEIILGLVILVIGEIFAAGYDLSEEQKLTIQHGYCSKHRRHDGPAENVPERTGGKSRHHTSQPFHPENRESQSHPVLYAGSRMPGTGLPAGRHPGIYTGRRAAQRKLKTSFILFYNP